MNYQPLFDLMLTHGLTLTETEMQDITQSVKKCLSIKEIEDKVNTFSNYAMEQNGFVSGVNYILEKL